MTEEVKYQICSVHGGDPLPLTEDNFYHRKNSKTGFDPQCKDCKSKYYAENRSHKWDNSKPKKVPVTGFDEACDKDAVQRLLRESYSIYQDAF